MVKNAVVTNPTYTQSLSEYNSFADMVNEILKDINTSMPVRVTAVRGTGVSPVGYVDCEILVQQLSGGDEPIDNGLCLNVPYLRIQGGKNAVICDPQVGDIGVATFAQRDSSGVNNVRGKAPPRSYQMLSNSNGYYHGGFLNGAPIRYIQLMDEGIILHAPDKITLEAPEVVINASSKFTVNSPDVSITSAQTTITGPIEITDGIVGGGSIIAAGDISAGGVSARDHVHSGVQSGGSNTGAPVK